MKVAKKEKRSKKERKGRPVETGAAVGIIKGGLRRLSLDDFHRCLEKPTQKNAPAFPQLPQARRRLTIQQSRPLSFNVSHVWGAVQQHDIQHLTTALLTEPSMLLPHWERAG
jgi:hypothetical protein